MTYNDKKRTEASPVTATTGDSGAIKAMPRGILERGRGHVSWRCALACSSPDCGRAPQSRIASALGAWPFRVA